MIGKQRQITRYSHVEEEEIKEENVFVSNVFLWCTDEP